MRHVARPVLDLSPVEARAASMRSWLIALLAWFCDVVDALPASAWRCAIVRDAYAAAQRGVAANLRRAVGDLRKIIFFHAHARFRFATGRVPLYRFARGVRAGVRAGALPRGQIWRRATAGIIAGMHEGPLRQRVQRLRAMLDNAEPLITRTLKRLPAFWRTPHGQRLVLVFAFETCEHRAQPSAPTPTNSS